MAFLKAASAASLVLQLLLRDADVEVAVGAGRHRRAGGGERVDGALMIAGLGGGHAGLEELLDLRVLLRPAPR